MKSVECIRLHDDDNVLVLPRGGSAGDNASGVILLQDIPPGHKIAATAVGRGLPIFKRGHPIGLAAESIEAGAWVHEHNMRTCMRAASAEDLPDWKASASPNRIIRTEISDKRFMGYRRERGKPGTRNDLWVMPTVNCLNSELRSLLRNYHKPYWIDSVQLLEHSCACSQSEEDLNDAADILAGLARHPNAAGILVVGLGCESLSVALLLERIAERNHWTACRHVKNITLQEEPQEIFFETLDKMAADAPRVRQSFPLSDLCVGVACAGFGAYSALRSNLLAGRFADYFVSRGGSVVATGITELFGAESAIVSRINKLNVYNDFISLRRRLGSVFEPFGNTGGERRPLSRERRDGISTPEERALEALSVTGHAPITQVLRYGEGVYPGGGVQLVSAFGSDPVACTSLAGSGAQLIVLATGSGTPFGTVVPTVKISSDADSPEKHPEWSDIDANAFIGKGEAGEELVDRFVDRILCIASGESAAHERKGFGEIAIFRGGVF